MLNKKSSLWCIYSHFINSHIILQNNIDGIFIFRWIVF